MMLTEHFTLEELTASDYAARNCLSNVPTDHEVLSNLYVLASGLENVREILGKPIHINSGYRSPKVNTGIGGSKNSAHLKGLAADFTVAGMHPKEVCLELSNYYKELGFDQLIYEGTWIHISWPDAEDSPRYDVLTAMFVPGKPTLYVRGIV